MEYQDVIRFINTATESQLRELNKLIQYQLTFRQSCTMRTMGIGSLLTFTGRDQCKYTARVRSINRTTISVTITDVDGFKPRFPVGTMVKVHASLVSPVTEDVVTR